MDRREVDEQLSYFEEEYDGYCFGYSPNGLNILAIKIEDGKFIEKELGYKYLCLTYKYDESAGYYDIDTYSTILGDPKYFIRNHLTCGYFGYVFKLCEESVLIVKELINSIFEEKNGTITEQNSN